MWGNTFYMYSKRGKVDNETEEEKWKQTKDIRNQKNDTYQVRCENCHYLQELKMKRHQLEGN